MVRLNKLYTKTGDSGTTQLVGGERRSKADRRIIAVGSIDELNAQLGICRCLAVKVRRKNLATQLQLVQQELFDLGAHAAQAPGPSQRLVAPESAWISRLENWIDVITEKLPPLKSFVLPGGSELCATLHVARCVCRRAEQSLVALHESEALHANNLRYVNRLSDFLFACTRRESSVSKHPELLWIPAHRRN